jgi:hypothetical protein
MPIETTPTETEPPIAITPRALLPIAITPRASFPNEKNGSSRATTHDSARRLDLEARRADDLCIADPYQLLSYDDALIVIARLVEVARSRGETLVVQLRRRFGSDPVAIIDRLQITAGHRALLLDEYRGKEPG